MLLNGPTIADCRNLADNQTLFFSFYGESNTNELLNWLLLSMESEEGRFWQHLILTLPELTELDIFLWMG